MQNTYQIMHDAALLEKIDKTFIPSEAIDQYEQDQFGDQVLSAQTWRDDLIHLAQNGEQLTGAKIPWPAANEFRLRPGELTVWSGYNGHFKSLILNQVILYLLRQGQKCTIASLELSPIQTLKRMASQAHGITWDELTEKSLHSFIDSLGGLTLYSEVGDMESQRVKALCRYCHAQGVNHVVIDSLMKCGVNRDNDLEKAFVNSLQNIAKQTGLHIHLVAHAKKPHDESDSPTKYGISGSADISNLPDNIVLVSKNIKKEQAVKQLLATNDVEGLKVADEKPDVYFEVAKQRHHPWEKTIYLRIDKSGQFTPMNRKKIHYV